MYKYLIFEMKKFQKFNYKIEFDSLYDSKYIFAYALINFAKRLDTTQKNLVKKLSFGVCWTLSKLPFHKIIKKFNYKNHLTHSTLRNILFIDYLSCEGTPFLKYRQEMISYERPHIINNL